MGLFDRGKYYRLSDIEPEKKKKEREIRHYKPPKPLSWLSCGILLFLGAALLCYGGALLLLRFAGAETDGAVNTRPDGNGGVEQVEVLGMTTTVSYTYRDAGGALHGGTSSLFGNSIPVGETIPLRYFPPVPALHVLSFRTEDILTPFGSLLLGIIVIGTALTRLREIRRREESQTE